MKAGSWASARPRTGGSGGAPAGSGWAMTTSGLTFVPMIRSQWPRADVTDVRTDEQERHEGVRPVDRIWSAGRRLVGWHVGRPRENGAAASARPAPILLQLEARLLDTDLQLLGARLDLARVELRQVRRAERRPRAGRGRRRPQRPGDPRFSRRPRRDHGTGRPVGDIVASRISASPTWRSRSQPVGVMPNMPRCPAAGIVGQQLQRVVPGAVMDVVARVIALRDRARLRIAVHVADRCRVPARPRSARQG